MHWAATAVMTAVMQIPSGAAAEPAPARAATRIAVQASPGRTVAVVAVPQTLKPSASLQRWHQTADSKSVRVKRSSRSWTVTA